MNKKILITGGAGFIGSALVRHIINHTQHSVMNVDKLTYAGNIESLSTIEKSKRYTFEQIDICNEDELIRVFKQYSPDIIIHLAAESHVDRSINDPSDFIQTNIFGTYNLLKVSKEYWSTLKSNDKNNFKFHHVSTDEVYGDLGNSDALFTESSPYLPSSPYSASKASSDHLVRAWIRTFKFPAVITNCSNNYGPYQFPEKLIPLIINNALAGNSLPIYGDGKQIRDWLYVDDHVEALINVALNSKNGETYNIGGNNQIQNIDVVKKVCKVLDELVPNKNNNFSKYEELITFVKDRSGHDLKYAIDAKKISNELNWKPQETFDTGIHKTVKWYLDNEDWCNKIMKKNLKNIGV